MPIRQQRNNGPVETPFEEQAYFGRIVQIVDIGLHDQGEYKGKPNGSRYEVMITVEFPDVRNDHDKPCWLSKSYVLPIAWPQKTGLKNNSNLYKLFNTFYPRLLKQSDKFPDYYFFDDTIWEKLLDTPVMCEIVINAKGYPRIVALGTLPKVPGQKFEVAELENKPLVFEAASATVEEWMGLFPWIRNRILKAEDEETVLAAQTLEEQFNETPAVEEDSEEEEEDLEDEDSEEDEDTEEDRDY